MSGSELSPTNIQLHTYRSPKTVIGRFVARRTLRGAILWALVFGIYVASKAIGFVDLYPTAAARQKIAETFGNNIGIELLIGKAPQSASTAAYVAWNTAILIVVIGSIWGLLVATKYFRGEEESGRSELLLSGQTTALRSTLNTLGGLWTSLIAIFLVSSLLFMAVGKHQGVDYSSHAAIYFALVTSLAIGVFLMIGALTSQLMPTRSKAAGLAGFILGLFFLVRGIGDITSAHWLATITPLGWVEKAQPLAHTKPIWLLSFIISIFFLLIFTLYFASKRDYQESIISDNANTKPSYTFLKSPFTLAIRLTKWTNVGWLIAIFLTSVLYGLLVKSTSKIFNQSKSFDKALSHLAQSAKLSSTLAFLGMVFFIQIVLIMALAANSLVAIRREEAQGYIDNFLAQPYSRLRWILGRLTIVVSVVILAGAITTLGVWLGVSRQGTGVTLHTLVLASINAIVPAIFVIGTAVLAFGFFPRLTSIFAYSVLVWSLLIELVGTGLNLNHWLLDTSLLHQVTLSPSVSPNWPVNLLVISVAVIFIIVGILRFNFRDIEGE